MAKISLVFFLFMLAVTNLSFARSARMLDELDVDSQPQVVVAPPLATFPAPFPTTFPAPQGVPGAASSTGQIPATSIDETPAPVATTTTTLVPAGPVADEEDDDDVATAPVAVAPVAGTPATSSPISSVPAPVVGSPATASPTGSIPSPVVGSPATASPTGSVPTAGVEPFSFFMHDILGGSQPSARVVTGIIANSGDNAIAFSKPYDNFFPVQGGQPLLINDNLNSIINDNNNIPFLAGLNGGTLQNTANNGVLNNAGNQPFVTAGQLPSTSTLQQLLFGSVTVIDDELTEAHELGSGVIGRAQGFYLASSLDGTSQTMALTALLHGGGHGQSHEVYDTISFFGVHRTASPESQIAVIGGTGKYENAKGYATVETLHHLEDQHTTDGVDTIVHFSVYLSAE